MHAGQILLALSFTLITQSFTFMVELNFNLSVVLVGKQHRKDGLEKSRTLPSPVVFFNTGKISFKVKILHFG